jgi:hypothetical protein
VLETLGISSFTDAQWFQFGAACLLVHSNTVTRSLLVFIPALLGALSVSKDLFGSNL